MLGPDFGLGGAAWRRCLLRVSLAHLLFAAVIFSPFLLLGYYLAGSIDCVYSILPNFLFSHDVLRKMDLGLWNPYIFCGVDFTSSPHNYIYNPLNWPLFIAPKTWFLALVTLRVFIEVWLLGVFGFMFFFAELRNRRWAFFASTLWQCGGFMILNITLYPNLENILFLTLALFLIWTFGRRAFWLDYCLLVFCVVIICLSTNPVGSVGSLILLAALFIYRHWPKSLNPFSKVSFVTGLAVFTGLMLSMVKLLPFAAGFVAAAGGGRISAGGFSAVSSNFPNQIYLGAAAFVPEILGVCVPDSLWPIKNIVGDFGKNLQVHCLSYFGGLAAALLCFAFFVRWRRRKYLFWPALLVVSVCWLLHIPPVSDIFSLLLGSCSHDYLPATIIPFAFVMTSALAGARLETAVSGAGGKHLRGWALLTGIVFLFLILTGVYAYDGFAFPARAAAAVFLFLVWIRFLFFRRWRASRVVILLAAPFAAAAFALWASGGLAGFRGTLEAGLGNLVFRCGFWGLLFEIFSVAAVVFSVHYFFIRGRRHFFGVLLICIAGLLTLGYTLFPFSQSGLGGGQGDEKALLAFLGGVRFLALSIFFLYIVSALGRGLLSRRVFFSLLFVMSLADLLVYDKIHLRMCSEPFHKGDIYAINKNFRENKPESSPAERRNLLSNDSFEGWQGEFGDEPSDWEPSYSGALKTYKDSAERVSGSIAARTANVHTAEQHNIHQTVIPGGSLKGRTFTFGIWVKMLSPGKAYLLLTDGVGGSGLVPVPGGGGWEWVTVTRKVMDDVDWVRAHLILDPGVTVCADGAVLEEGGRALPFFAGDPDHIQAPWVAGAEKMSSSEPMDIKNYRVSEPVKVLGLFEDSPEVPTNAPEIFGVRQYGGTNSVMPVEHIKFYLGLGGTASLSCGAMDSNVKIDRYLDLTGCGYTYSPSDKFLWVRRPGALPRFAFFTDYEIISGERNLLGKLRAPDFDIKKTLILERDPGIARGEASDFIKLDYDEKRTCNISVNVTCGAPGLLFFGDSYSPFWRASVNGAPAPVLRADYKFMAVPLAAGVNSVTLRFTPKYFYCGAAVSAAGLILLLVTAPALFFIGRHFRRGREKSVFAAFPGGSAV